MIILCKAYFLTTTRLPFNDKGDGIIFEVIMFDEVFRRTAVSDRYYVTKEGEVAKIEYVNGKMKRFLRMRKEVSSSGHLRVEIDKKHYLIHRLVYECWSGESLIKGLVVDHIDANPANNNIENLRQVSQKENIHNAIRHGNFGRAGCRKIKVYDKVNGTTKNYDSIKEFLIDIEAPDYIIKHCSLSGLEKRTEYKERFVVEKIYEY